MPRQSESVLRVVRVTQVAVAGFGLALSVAGCPENLGGLVEVNIGGESAQREGSGGTDLRTIADGSSTTVLFGEEDATSAAPRGGGAPGRDNETGGGAPPSIPVTPAEPPSGADDGSPQTTDEAVAFLTNLLADKGVKFGSSSGNSGNDAFATSVRTIALCGFGRFSMRELTLFSASLPGFSQSFDSENFAQGTWRVVFVPQQGFFLELTIDNTTSDNLSGVQRFSLDAAPDGSVIVIDGETAEVEDGRQFCAENQGQF